MKYFKNLILLYIVIFLISSLVIHLDKWTKYPVEHFKALLNHSSPFHPFIYSLIIFTIVLVIIVVLQSITKLLKKLFKNK
ncbi:hypothetical protein CP960_09225 [Malaciobacter halophilus]|uniref:Uncharacterized protein n=1 Tax=Malaciobacter halophilus TaxID=197482 RepID=A0A2N1J1N8_9BACT|nr:hypothetical protein [Malaciobacter halophilus]AXH08611.1 putative membrane protein [Malaciobacter halophilus]PKI80456.1 hypothetical protein CP960_09225 [Malaciobacter halophilus]